MHLLSLLDFRAVWGDVLVAVHHVVVVLGHPLQPAVPRADPGAVTLVA